MHNKHYQQLQQESGRNGHFSKVDKEIHQTYGKEKDILISTVLVMLHPFIC
jgi:hypothetical protein